MELKDKKIYNYFDNNKLAIEKVFDDYTNYVYKIINNSYTSFSKEDIEEIILDVFFTLWNNQNKLDYNRNMSAYIAGITRNIIKKKSKKNRTNNNIEDFQEEMIDMNNIELNLIQKEKNKIMYDELEKLKPDMKNIFIEYYYSDKSISQISTMFNISKSKIKTNLYRVRKKLKKALIERGENYNE